MQAKSPKQIVTEKFGSRSQLVSEIAKISGADGEEKQRLMGTTNKKLLRIHETAQQAQDKFGGKAGLIKAIEELKFEGRKGSAAWTKKMEGMTVKRLLEVHRQSR
jgi:hypothetical protein